VHLLLKLVIATVVIVVDVAGIVIVFDVAVVLRVVLMTGICVVMGLVVNSVVLVVGLVGDIRGTVDSVILMVVMVLVRTQFLAILLIPSTTSSVVLDISPGDVNQKTLELAGLEAMIGSEDLLHRDIKPTVIILTPVDCVDKASAKMDCLSI